MREPLTVLGRMVQDAFRREMRAVVRLDVEACQATGGRALGLYNARDWHGEQCERARAILAARYPAFDVEYYERRVREWMGV